MDKLTIMPYYGAKARPALQQFIIEHLDCRDTKIFVDLFGGAANVLLNKPPHELEYYNEYGYCMCALMRTLTSWDDTNELVSKLLETEYSEPTFEKAKQMFNYYNKEVLQYSEDEYLAEVKDFLVKHDMVNKRISKKNLTAKLKDNVFVNKLLQELKTESDINVKNRLSMLSTEYSQLLETDDIPWRRDLETQPISDIELGYYAYLTFLFSRDGMGEIFSDVKFKNDQAFHDRVLNLYKCSERMFDVAIWQNDAVSFFRRYAKGESTVTKEDRAIVGWINDPQVMIYADPSYIRPESEEEALDGIDWRNVPSVWEAIKEKYDAEKKGKLPRNLGELYSKSFDYETQELFLKSICSADARIAISNYDLKLYEKYLDPARWTKYEFMTTTSIGGKADNTRLECLWCNY